MLNVNCIQIYSIILSVTCHSLGNFPPVIHIPSYPFMNFRQPTIIIFWVRVIHKKFNMNKPPYPAWPTPSHLTPAWPTSPYPTHTWPHSTPPWLPHPFMTHPTHSWPTPVWPTPPLLGAPFGRHAALGLFYFKIGFTLCTEVYIPKVRPTKHKGDIKLFWHKIPIYIKFWGSFIHKKVHFVHKKVNIIKYRLQIFDSDVYQTNNHKDTYTLHMIIFTCGFCTVCLKLIVERTSKGVIVGSFVSS